jgi:hypothetical protein
MSYAQQGLSCSRSALVPMSKQCNTEFYSRTYQVVVHTNDMLGNNTNVKRKNTEIILQVAKKLVQKKT